MESESEMFPCRMENPRKFFICFVFLHMRNDYITMSGNELCGHPTAASYFYGIFGQKVRKIPIDASLGCPNRDGSSGGCIFCNNSSFRPRYLSGEPGITQQIEAGVRFFRRKLEDCAVLPYFQTYSNTHGLVKHLISLYEEALTYPGVAGIVIATRPGCFDEELLDYFEKRFGNSAPEGHPYLLVELGIESTEDRTLCRINRGHDFECSSEAVHKLSSRGIAVGAHLILGLPGETEEDWLNHAARLSRLPVSLIKLHHLQIVKGTALAAEYERNPGCVHLFSPDEYAVAAKQFLLNLRRDIAIDRLVSETPAELLVAPSWGMKPDVFLALFKKMALP